MDPLISKLPNVGTTIFTIMSALARKHKAVNLSQGFPDFDCSPELQERVAYHLSHGKNQYAPMAGLPALREAIQSKIQNIYNLQVDHNEEVTIVAGATQGIFTAIQAFIRIGDEVIIIEPAYDCYRPAVDLVGGITKAYQLSHPDYKIDWSEIEEMISSRTKMIVVNTPHNPIGKVLSKDDLQHLERISEKHDLIVLSDEVYEHLIYDRKQHESVLNYPNLYKRSIAVYSFGKTFHVTGWKMGYVVAPPRFTVEFRKVHQFNVFCVNSFVQYGLADYMADPFTYLSLSDFYQRKRDVFTDAMKTSKFKALSSEGTFFQLYDYSALSNLDDITFSKKLTTEHGVAVIPLSPFRNEPSTDKVVRFCFAKKEETLLAAADKLSKIAMVL